MRLTDNPKDQPRIDNKRSPSELARARAHVVCPTCLISTTSAKRYARALRV